MNRTPWWARARTAPVRDSASTHRWTARAVTVRVLVTITIVGGLFVAATGTAQPRVQDVGGGITAVRQSTESLIGGCGPVYEKEPAPGTVGVIPSVKADRVTPNVPSYGTIVPMTGAFWSPPAPPDIRMYTPFSRSIPRPTQLLHNLWEGALVVYYAPNTSATDLKNLHAVADTRADLNAIIVPWDSARGPLPLGRTIAFSVWGASQTCQRLMVVALNQFRVAHPQNTAPGASGRTPPQLKQATTAG